MKLWRRARSQQGSQMVEFALIAPIMVYLVLCIPVFAILARSWLVVSAAARDGARAASLYSVSDRYAVARNRAEESVMAQLGTKPDSVRVSVVGNMVQVTVTYSQPTYIPLMGFLMGSGGSDKAKLEATSKFVLEGS